MADKPNIKLVSFDLDDALYDNQPVIAQAEKLSKAYLQSQFELQCRDFDYDNFLRIRRRLLAQDNPAFENMSYFRQQALMEYCHLLENKEKIAQQAFQLFINARSQAEIPQAIHNMVQSVAANFLVVSVTNGNCDPNQLSVGSYFLKNYSPLAGYRAKPHPQMLLTTINDFNLTPQQVLHVGDSIDKDGLASQQAGTHFVQFSPFAPHCSLENEIAKVSEFLGIKVVI